MGFIELILLAIALGSDAFSVAVCVGLQGATVPQRVRLASGFGAFQFLMPIIGLYAGRWFGRAVGNVAGYIGGSLLVFLGLFMIYRAVKEGLHCPAYIHTSTLALFSASLGVSLDALAVGFGFGTVSGQNILIACTVIGAIAFTMTGIGLEIGNQVGKYIENKAVIVSGLILAAVGIRIIISS